MTTLTRRESRGRQILRRAARIYRKQGRIHRGSMGDTRPFGEGQVCAVGAVIRARRELKYSLDEQFRAECLLADVGGGFGTIVTFNDRLARKAEQVAARLEAAAA